MAIEFVSDTQNASFHSPLEDFDLVDVEVEVREDPLTGRHGRIVPDNFLTPDEEPDIEEVVTNAEGCFFCPDMVEDVTPTYPDWVGKDRGCVGEATSFPNLNPYGAYSNVVVLTEDHFRPMAALGPDVFADGLAAALEYVNAVVDHDEDAEFASVNMNFLRPAGSSIIHPHIQTLIDDRGTNEARQLARKARAYRDEHGDAYWADLVDAERNGDRWIGTIGETSWLAPYAPKHHRHVLGIADGPGIPAPDDPIVADLGNGIASVLSAYDAAGLNSFNFAMHLVADDPACPPVVNLVARSVFDRYYWSDSPFFTVLHDEGVVDVAPESYAAETAASF